MNKQILFYLYNKASFPDDQRPLRWRICQPIRFIQQICVAFAARKFNIRLQSCRAHANAY